MKKITILLLILILVLCTYFGVFYSYQKVEYPKNYKPIPKELSKQYKEEIESYINKKAPLTNQEIKKAFLSCKNLEISENKLKYKEKIQAIDDCFWDIDAPEFVLYLDLIEITEKYVDIKDIIPATSESINLAAFIFPYLVDNKINYSKLSKLDTQPYEKLTQMRNYYINKLYK